MDIKDFPKLESPFMKDDDYILTSLVREGYEWVFEDGVRAVDKLHGTNICVNIKDQRLHSIDNRTTRIIDEGYSLPIKLTGIAPRAYEGVIHCLEKDHLRSCLKEGRNYGELVGPRINGNLHGLTRHLFVPFEYLREYCHWKSWVQNKYPKTFDSISDWFRELPSLYTQKVTQEIRLGEGIVFHHPNGKMAKLRRDMFDWYEED